MASGSLLALLLAAVAIADEGEGGTRGHSIEVQEETTFGILIDAGSTGSRMHIYEWSSRTFSEIPPPLSLPLTSERWSERIRPGLSAFGAEPSKAAKTLAPLLDKAKEELAGYEDYWSEYPIYVKATAGMRELPEAQRDAIITAVRAYLADDSTCPFRFENDEQARVIAGEEEAAYAWVAVNFVDGALLDATAGPFGTATPSRARGSLEMGGSSSQISFYKPQQDILAGLFKLQLGTRAHINLYGHSFLHYGRVSSRRLHWSHLAAKHGCWDEADGRYRDPKPCVVADPCVPAGEAVSDWAQTSVTGVFGLSPPLTHGNTNGNVTVTGTRRSRESYAACRKQVRDHLFDPSFNRWCEYSHNGQCAYIGVYQPRLPEGPDYGNFVLLGNYVKLFSMLKLPRTTNLREFAARADAVCGGEDEPLPEGKLSKDEFCFVAAFAYESLTTGHGFDGTRNYTYVDSTQYNGAHVNVGWPLGAMLYEINALPWTYVAPRQKAPDDDGGDDAAAVSREQVEVPPGKRKVFFLRERKASPEPRRTPAGAVAVAAALIAVAAVLLAVERRHSFATGGRDAWADPEDARRLDDGRDANCCDAWTIAPPAAAPSPSVHSPRHSLRSGSLP